MPRGHFRAKISAGVCVPTSVGQATGDTHGMRTTGLGCGQDMRAGGGEERCYVLVDEVLLMALHGSTLLGCGDLLS